jgi:hypothetical protein
MEAVRAEQSKRRARGKALSRNRRCLRQFFVFFPDCKSLILYAQKSCFLRAVSLSNSRNMSGFHTTTNLADRRWLSGKQTFDSNLNNFQ